MVCADCWEGSFPRPSDGREQNFLQCGQRTVYRRYSNFQVEMSWWGRSDQLTSVYLAGKLLYLQQHHFHLN
jgi:hypothetical protein